MPFAYVQRKQLDANGSLEYTSTEFGIRFDQQVVTKTYRLCNYWAEYILFYFPVP